MSFLKFFPKLSSYEIIYKFSINICTIPKAFAITCMQVFCVGVRRGEGDRIESC